MKSLCQVIYNDLPFNVNNLQSLFEFDKHVQTYLNPQNAIKIKILTYIKEQRTHEEIFNSTLLEYLKSIKEFNDPSSEIGIKYYIILLSFIDISKKNEFEDLKSDIIIFLEKYKSKIDMSDDLIEIKNDLLNIKDICENHNRSYIGKTFIFYNADDYFSLYKHLIEKINSSLETNIILLNYEKINLLQNYKEIEFLEISGHGSETGFNHDGSLSTEKLTIDKFLNLYVTAKNIKQILKLYCNSSIIENKKIKLEYTTKTVIFTNTKINLVVAILYSIGYLHGIIANKEPHKIGLILSNIFALHQDDIIIQGIR
ncbi:MAG: hypothetical protein WBB31_13280 [Saprospiraceae bacterium]